MTDATTNTGTPKRPTFLTVLCILSFIGCAIGLLNFKDYFEAKAEAAKGGASQVADAMDQAMDDAMASGEMSESERELAESLGSAIGNLDYNAIATASLVKGLMVLVCLVGVLMMWRLKKTGFYIYTLAQIVFVAAPFIWIGGLAGGFMGILMGLHHPLRAQLETHALSAASHVRATPFRRTVEGRSLFRGSTFVPCKRTATGA
jgi:hypothetical protein